MTSTWFPNGPFDIEMIEDEGRHTAKVYLRGLDNTRALMAESNFETDKVAFSMAMDKAFSQLSTLGMMAHQARKRNPVPSQDNSSDQ